MSPHSLPLSSSEEDLSSSHTNGRHTATYTNGTNGAEANGRPKFQHKVKEQSKYLQSASFDDGQEYDLVCIGFGPASLAVGVALHDALSAGQALTPNGTPPKVLFIEKQTKFAWHAGMLLPGAKMQISFVKDLATLRNPRSEFTFLNYLHEQGRLVDFTNLDTFLPARSEFEDYLRWCSEAFDHVVEYGQEVVSISPKEKIQGGPAKAFEVQARNAQTGAISTCRGRNVLVATGGQASLPKSLPANHPRVIHSSQFAQLAPKILNDPNAPYRVTVIGAGQSAAEIFNNVQTLYPNSQTKLVMRQEFLRPSDDSPFVNAVFNPEYVDKLYPKSAGYRNNFITEARATNYGVVRLELIEHLYERMYSLRRELGPDERVWPHRIMGGRRLTAVEPKNDETIRIKTAEVQFEEEDFSMSTPAEEEWEADLVVAATGYRRDAHVNMLKDTWALLPQATSGVKSFEKPVTGWTVQADGSDRKMAVDRSYQVQYKEGTIAPGAGVWLQGSCEGTHGLSDSLLSVLSTRSGEIVDSIFGREAAA